MLSFASRGSNGVRKHPLHPLCLVHLTLNSPGCGKPAAFLSRGFAAQAQTQPATKRARARARARSTNSESTTSKPTTSKPTTDKPKTSKPTTSKPTTSKPTTSKPTTSKPMSKKISKTPQPSPSKIESKNPAPTSKRATRKRHVNLPTPHSPQEVSEIWRKSMDVVNSMNKIGPMKLNDTQVTLMAGTLDVIKTVLQAQKIIRTDDKTQASKDADAANKVQADKKSETDKSPNAFATARLNPLYDRSLHPTSDTPSDKSVQPPTSDASTAEETLRGWKKKHKLGVREMTAGGVLKPIDVPTPPVPLIQYGLDRVLFNEGVYNLQDPRTGVFNFDPYLAEIMPVTEFDFDALKEYITSSKDKTLLDVTKMRKKKYTGSTSSMTATLAHFHFLLSNWRKINLARISRQYEPELQNFVGVLKAPAATFLNYNDGVYAIDADKEWDDDTILSMLGKSMELLLTAPKAEYEKYRRTVSHQLTEEERNKPESYHYTEFDDFVMRSQLDAYDPRLPGTGVYDLKTRAVVAIRMDAINYKKGRSYEIQKRTGEWESFEREYHDMIRGAFLKYSLQVRMGRMDGIFVAFHNTQRIFGFQYIPLEEMDHSIHGTMNKSIGDREFKSSLKLWNMMLNKATKRFPHQSLRIHVETRPSTDTPFMYFFAEPVTPEEVNKIQVRDQAHVDKFREQVLGISPQEPTVDEVELTTKANEPDEDGIFTEEHESANEDDVLSTTERRTVSREGLNEFRGSEKAAEVVEEDDSEEVWENMMSVVEETMENDVQGITAIRDAIEEALQQSGLLKARSSEEAQHYVDALLKAIVDVEVQRTKVETSGESTITPSAEPDSGSEAVEEVSASQEHVDKESATTETQSAGRSAFGYFSNFLNSFKQSETAAVEKPASQEIADATDSPAPQSSELVDLIVKMTSRAGVPSDDAQTTQEVSDDQAKLRKFETLLSELVKADDSAEAESEETTSPFKDESNTAPPKSDDIGTAQKPVFGMILTVRNKVNNSYVDRPENLHFSDDWKIEYCMEEIPEDKVQQLYGHLKARRKKAFLKDPKARRFETMFGGALKRYSVRGDRHRKMMNKLDAEKRPLFVVGTPDPFTVDNIGRVKTFQGLPPDIRKVQNAKTVWELKERKLRAEKLERSTLSDVKQC